MNRILTFAARYRAWLIGAALLAFTHAGAFGFGVLHAERGHAKQAVAEAQADVRTAQNETVAVIEHNNGQAAERIEVKVRDLARERQLADQLQQARQERDALQEILYASPDPAPDCRVSVGDLRLLNNAATAGRSDADGGTSDPAFVAAAQEQTPSTVSCRDLVSGEIDVRVQYNELATRHDALVDWIEQELIEPQIAVDASSNNQ